MVVGCGRVGARLATRLADEGHDVVVVDQDAAAFANLGATFNGLTVAGTGIDQDVLKKAGIERADAFAAVTSNDSVNCMAAQVAQEIFGVPRVVARVNEPRYESVLEGTGILAVCPAELGVAALKGMLLAEGVQVRQALGAGEVLLADLVLDEQWKGRPVTELEIPGKLKVCAVIREGRARVAEPDLLGQPGDVVVVSVRLDAFEFLDLKRGGDRL
ncbi:MAG: TrkA family potassium uptake protein [Bacillota bacterium]|nr:TrkA family potassium uptake protein [Bacillota bacterium]